MASIVGGIQVQEALKLLKIEDWQDRTLVSRELAFNGTVGDVYVAKRLKRPDCALHSIISKDTITSVALPVATTSVEKLIKTAQKIWADAVSIELDFDLAVEIRCPPKCGRVRPVFLPLYKVYQEDWECPACGWRPRFEGDLGITHRLSAHMDFVSAPKLLKAKLADIGIPPFAILQVLGVGSSKRGRSSKGERKQTYLELAGDEPNLGFQVV